MEPRALRTGTLGIHERMITSNSKALIASILFVHFSYASQAQRVAHMIVALCDNVNQGIVKVPATIGNGQDPDRNLYWGAGCGVRHWFTRKSGEWTLLRKWGHPEDHILERVLWKHRSSDVYLIADAYDGAFIQQAINDVLDFAGGHAAKSVRVDSTTIHFGGAAGLIAYCGHDGLMEFAPPPVKPPANAAKRETIILACIGKRFFAEPLKATGAQPLLWSTGLMSPEAYTLDAALQGWARNETAAQVRERAAQAYHQWQKCGLSGARRLLVSGW